MATGQWVISLVRPEDNVVLAQLLREALIEMEVPFDGTAISDLEMDAMYDTYQYVRDDYWVVCHRNRILGVADIATLRNVPYGHSELQKIYFLPNARARGLGSQLMRKCLQQPKKFRFTDRYLDTIPNMMYAQKLYQKLGFEYIEHPLDNTNHYSCSVWMVKTLRDDT